MEQRVEPLTCVFRQRVEQRSPDDVASRTRCGSCTTVLQEHLGRMGGSLALHHRWSSCWARRSSARSRRSQRQEMTISGCLRAAPNPSGSPDVVTYLLEPIETTTPMSTTKPLTQPKSGMRYTLTTTSTSIALKPHVGHKVELVGGS